RPEIGTGRVDGGGPSGGAGTEDQQTGMPGRVHVRLYSRTIWNGCVPGRIAWRRRRGGTRRDRHRYRNIQCDPRVRREGRRNWPCRSTSRRQARSARVPPAHAPRSPEVMTMRIGVPRETKTLEGRVALVPAAAGDLVKRGHEVWVEKGAGLLSGFRDEDYARLGVKIAPDAAALYEKGELIVKVKEPIGGDLEHLRGDHL